MAQRTQISLPDEDHRRARSRAADQGISLAEYIRRLVASDLHSKRSGAPVEALFGLGASTHGSDVAANKDAYVGEAAEADALRRSGP